MRQIFSEQLIEALDRVETSPALLRLKMIELRNTLDECQEVEVRAEGKLILDALRRKIMLQPNFSLADVAAKLKTHDETSSEADTPRPDSRLSHQRTAARERPDAA
jgi:hypothetical protein